MNPNPTDFPLVAVYWLDYPASHGWEHLEDAQRPQPPTVVSYGRMIKEHADYVIIAGTYAGGCSATNNPAQTCGAMTIPRCAINRIYKLKMADTLYLRERPDYVPADKSIQDAIDEGRDNSRDDLGQSNSD